MCGYSFIASVTPVAIKFVAGTSDARDCNHGSRDLSGSLFNAASGGLVNAVGQTPILWTNANEGLCINLSNGAPVGGHITYTRY